MIEYVKSGYVEFPKIKRHDSRYSQNGHREAVDSIGERVGAAPFRSRVIVFDYA